MLICQPVSQRSEPEKIERWISHLEALRGKHRGDATAERTIDHFMGKAQSWIGDNAGAEGDV